MFLGQDRFGAESMEGSAMLGIVVSLPLSVVLEICFDWGGYADQWVLFLATVPAANGALLGAATGLVVALVKRLAGTKH